MPIKPHFNPYFRATQKFSPDDVFVCEGTLDGSHISSSSQWISNLPNAIPIPVLRDDKFREASFLKDEDQPFVEMALERVIPAIEMALSQGRDVHWPACGIGTGVSGLRKRAPAIYQSIGALGRELFDQHGEGPWSTLLIGGGLDFKGAEISAIKALIEDFTSPGMRKLELMTEGTKGAGQLASRAAYAMEGVTKISTYQAEWRRYRGEAGARIARTMLDHLSARIDQFGMQGNIILIGQDPQTRVLQSSLKSIDPTSTIPVHETDLEQMLSQVCSGHDVEAPAL